MNTEWWRDELQGKRDQNLYRTLRVLPSHILDLASNDYLGFARHPEVIAAACEAAQHFGAGARASRLVSGQNQIHANLEAQLAAFKGCEAALVFPSGYHANLAVITAFARNGDEILCDKRNHASLIDACFLAQARGAQLRFYNSLEKLRSLLERNADGKRIIVSDAVYSMDGDLAPIPELINLSHEFKALLVLDDAHGTGVLGPTGRGTLEQLGIAKSEIKNASLIQVGTLSKALGSQGGFVAGSASIIEWLINAGRSFIYTTGLNPAACGAALTSLELIDREPERLQRLRKVKTKLAQGLSALGFDAQEQLSPIIPVMVGEASRAVELSDKLLAQNIWCPSIRPPTVPKDSSRLRVTASADLSNEDIAEALTAFAKCV